MMKIKCLGCGAFIQTADEHSPGYVKPAVLEAHPDDILCERCFRIKHYNDLEDVQMESGEFRKILSDIGSLNALIVNVVDIFDIQGSMVRGLSRYIGNNDVIIAANKRDLLPKSIKDNKLIQFVRRSIKEYGLKAIDAVLVSAKKGYGIDALMAAIEMHRHNRSVYVVGCTNVGKSSLINAVIKRFGNAEDVITVSQYPGTTLGLIEIPLSGNAFLIDTPGIINEHQYAFYLKKTTLKKIMPHTEIKPKNYQLESGQTLFFGGLARFDYITGEKGGFTLFFNNELPVHRTKTEHADTLFENQAGMLLSPPDQEEVENLGAYRRHVFKIPDRKTDVVISGLGFITLNRNNITVAVHAPQEVGVFTRPSLF